jgi:hypothetical protein
MLRIMYANKVAGIDDLKTQITDVITTSNKVMLGSTWEDLEF